MLVAMLPLAQVFLLRALRNVVFIRGAAVGVTETVGAAFVLLLPYCLVAGYALTLACSILAREEGPAGIGRAYVADSIGSIIGGVLFSFVLVRFLDHIAILVCPALLNLVLAALVGLRVRGSKFEVQGSTFAASPAPRPRPGSGPWPDRRRPFCPTRTASPPACNIRGSTSSPGPTRPTANSSSPSPTASLISWRTASRSPRRATTSTSRRPCIMRWRSGPRRGRCCWSPAASPARRGKSSNTVSARLTTWNSTL